MVVDCSGRYCTHFTNLSDGQRGTENDSGVISDPRGCLLLVAIRAGQHVLCDANVKGAHGLSGHCRRCWL